MANSVDLTLEGTMKFSHVKKVFTEGEYHEYNFFTDSSTTLSGTITTNEGTYTLEVPVPDTIVTITFSTYNNKYTANVYLKIPKTMQHLPLPISIPIAGYDVSTDTTFASITLEDTISQITLQINENENVEAKATKDTTVTINITSSTS